MTNPAIETLNEIAKQLDGFNPYVIESENKLIVPKLNIYNPSSPNEYHGQILEMEECCGVDADLWHEEKGYFILEHPEM